MNRNLSIYLDLVRFLAALTVVLDHVSTKTPASYFWHLRPMGHEAVVIFFVLSGFVIAYAAGTKDHDLSSFAVSRLSRLYSVLLPCLIITPLITLWGQNINPGVYIGPITDLTSWSDPTGIRNTIENALFLNQAGLESAIYFGNGPMWSLSYEFWYYVIFGAAFFLRGWPRAVAVIIGCLIAGPKILLLMPVWLMGVAAYHVMQRGISARLGKIIVAASVAALFSYFLLHIDARLNQLGAAMIGPQNMPTYQFSEYFVADNVLGLIIAAHFIGMAGVSSRIRFGAVTPLIRRLAGFTFSLYLFHFPLMYFCNAALPHDMSPNWRATAIFIGAVGGSCLLGFFTERKKHIYVQVLETVRSRWLIPSKPASETA